MTDLEKLAADVANDVVETIAKSGYLPQNRTFSELEIADCKATVAEQLHSQLEAASAAGRIEGLKEAAELAEKRERHWMDEGWKQKAQTKRAMHAYKSEGSADARRTIRARIQELEDGVTSAIEYINAFEQQLGHTELAHRILSTVDGLTCSCVENCPHIQRLVEELREEYGTPSS